MRDLAFDVTHICSRLAIERPSGIDKVDMAYARHFANARPQTLVHYGFRRPRCHDGDLLKGLVTAADHVRWTKTSAAADPAYRNTVDWLFKSCGLTNATANCSAQSDSGGSKMLRWGRHARKLAWRMSPGRAQISRDAIYLNVAQHAFEFPRFFNWLEERPDIVTVFLVHDLLPLDFPEYFRPGYRQRFNRRFDTISRRAGALITTSSEVRDRVLSEYARRGLRQPPIVVQPLPSSLADNADTESVDEALAAIPYFVILGTIEPRKNHLLLLNIWRRMVEERRDAPKLVIVGARGWENEQVLDVLDRGSALKPHVYETSGLSDAGVVRLLRNSRGLLMPSFAEGYGLPVVEALSLGVPVIASDIPVFHEVGSASALYRHPLDGPGWRADIEALADRDSSRARQARAAAASFEALQWSKYFQSIEVFLSTL